MAPRRFAFRLFYLGRDFHGIQFQPSPKVPTIIKTVAEALQKCGYITSAKENCLQFAGRTDKGVNSLANTIAFTTEKTPFQESLFNDAMPATTCAWATAEVPLDFNPRSWALRREYRYFLPRYGPDMNLDVNRMHVATVFFLGEHDFKNFAKPEPGKSTWTSIDEVEIVPAAAFYEIRFAAPRFVWNQVRRMVRVLRDVGAGEIDPEQVRRWVDLEEPAAIHPADPEHLVLWNVIYPEDIEFVVREGYLKRIGHNLAKERDELEKKTRSLAGLLTFKDYWLL